MAIQIRTIDDTFKKPTHTSKAGNNTNKNMPSDFSSACLLVKPPIQDRQRQAIKKTSERESIYDGLISHAPSPRDLENSPGRNEMKAAKKIKKDPQVKSWSGALM